MRETRPQDNNQFSAWQKKVWGDGQGVPVPPNLGGERVIRAKKKPAASSSAAAEGEGDGGFSTRRVLLLGLLAQPVFYLGAQQFQGGGGGMLPAKKGKEKVDSYFDGDAVTSPLLEIQLLELLEEQAPSPARDAKAAAIVAQMEERGGTAIFASNGQGRWVMPWVGGWERVWSDVDDMSFLGGPSKASFGKRGVTLDQIGHRHFVYGPGEGGIVTEYLHSYKSDKDAPVKFLLTRPGTVTNLGENVFQLDFATPLDEYEVYYDKARGVDRLANCVETKGPDGALTGLLQCSPLTDGGAERGAPVSQLLVKTSYLSSRMWIVRDARDERQCAVFQRSETRSVMDRRGLIADGQLKPSDDESIRYGRLLFGETQQEYSGWDEKQAKAKAEKDKLLAR